MRNVLDVDFSKAVEEIKFFLRCKAREVSGYGWLYHLDDDAPESYGELQRRSLNMNIPIATSGSSNTIYGEEVNTLFRFWHDVTHLTLDKDFSLEGEKAVIEEHMKEAREAKLSELAMDILKADTLGQVLYYYRHKKFVENQKAFVDTCIKIGYKRAVAYVH